MKKKFYLTTPIYYINSVPTIGSAYTTIVGDVLARWHRLKQEKVFLLTGLDENSIKTVKAAEEKGYNNVQKYTDDMAKKWIEVWKKLNISYDGFVRTTEDRHKKFAQEFFLKLKENGDVYKDIYEGLYCDDCETYLSEGNLVEGKCSIHKKVPEKISEQNYFFKLSKYQDRILKHIEENKKFLLPESRRKEIINFIKQGLKDISISRENAEWGIEVPEEKNMKFWCWFEAVLNYLSGAEENWPADLHIIGKDITKFHSIYFIGFLLSWRGEKALPKQIFAHGFFTINGQKISKSLGNTIDPVHLSNKYSVDSLRYYLIREISFGEDGDFSEEALKNRINNELANDLGNLVSRSVSLVEKNFNGKMPKGKNELKFDVKRIEKLMGNYELTRALDEIWKFVKEINKYINEKRPWEKEDKKDILYTILDGIRIVSILLYPFIPETCGKISKQLGFEIKSIKDCRNNLLKEGKVKKDGVLFRKIEKNK